MVAWIASSPLQTCSGLGRSTFQSVNNRAEAVKADVVTRIENRDRIKDRGEREREREREREKIHVWKSKSVTSHTRINSLMRGFLRINDLMIINRGAKAAPAGCSQRSSQKPNLIKVHKGQTDRRGSFQGRVGR